MELGNKEKEKKERERLDEQHAGSSLLPETEHLWGIQAEVIYGLYLKLMQGLFYPLSHSPATGNQTPITDPLMIKTRWNR